MTVLNAPIIAFGFANFAMLGWLGAAAAPILIHLWMRQTHRETAWAAVRFLRAALERQARRLRLQHWLLLAVRTLLLILIAIAAAKPLLESGLLGGGIPTHHVLIVDASLSMSARDANDETALERAKQTAQAVVEQSRAGDAVSLIVMGADAGVPLGRPISDSNAAAQAIAAISPSEGMADLPRALTTAGQLIQSDRQASSDRRQEILVFSDMGANSWSALSESAENKATGELIAELDQAAALSIYDVGAADQPNFALTSLALADSLPTLAAPVELRGEAMLFQGDATERVIELVVDGVAVAQQQVQFTPGEPMPIEFVHRFERGGPIAISLRLAKSTDNDDRLAADDERFAALTLRERVRVLCVAGSPGAADYLAAALDPTGEGTFEPVVVSDADLPTIELREYVCVFLSNVRELSGQEAGRLKEYVARGGGVALLLGDRVNATRYNEVLAPPRELREGAGLGAVRLSEPAYLASVDAIPQAPEKAEVKSPDWLMPGWLSPSVSVPSYRVDPLEYAHPIAQPFRGQERAGLLNTPVMRHFPLTIPEQGSSVDVVMALENGDPLLVTSQLGRGRTALLTTAATLDSIDPATGQAWTALPAWPSFLPIVRGMVRYLASDEASGSDRLVGDTISGQTAPNSFGQIEVIPPEGIDPSLLTPDADGTWTYASTKRAGVYRVGPADEPPSRAIAINLDPTESDPTVISADQLPESWKVRRGMTGDSSSSDAIGSPTPIHRWLLYGALGLALIEPAMACLFGRSGR